MTLQERPWGTWEMLIQSDDYWVKRITVQPGHRLSLQKHKHRAERWICVEGAGTALIIDWPKTLKNGNAFYLKPGNMVDVWPKAEHRLINDGTELLVVIEVAIRTGDELTEEDIERIDDDYSRHV